MREEDLMKAVQDLVKKQPVSSVSLQDNCIAVVPGLTKRELFAGMAMQSLEIGAQIPENAAKYCVAYADALLDELSKKAEGKKDDRNKFGPETY